MPAQIIAVLGSPLAGGNTATLLDQAIQGARDAGCDVEKILVNQLNIRPCMEIFYCMENEACRIQDEMTPIYEKFRDMDGLIVASPVMTMGIPGKLKIFLDRFQVFYMAKYFREKPFISREKRRQRKMLFISIAGMDIDHVFEGAKMTMRAFGEIIDCPYWGEVLRNDMDTIKDIRTRPEVMEAAYRKGNELGRLLAGESA
ncbi:MAG: flavodoxin family protein [Methanomicrobiaceae archaeon]|uniref:Iron-sulfur flavoprotein n=1 Tax=hydrocarbon metagenome TaxID=938273 RepID=A0A0W8FE01_9ZZZZ|nr:flavodoxin family protein [Methanomicrobiaceae archaeon]MDD5419266.1 flavodoxin family protein [Methanomicrobiaceae archaeon]